MRPFVMLATIVALAFPTAAIAQTSVSASLIGNIARVDSVDNQTYPTSVGSSGNGESLGVALRVTQPLADRWGLELEFAWPGDIDNEFTYDLPYTTGPELGLLSPQLRSSLVPPGVIPPIQQRVASSLQFVTVGTTAWYKQPVGDRSSLVYSAGVSFLRARQEYESSYSNPVLLALFPPPVRTELISYSAGVLLGFDARIGMTEHLELVPGIRFHASRSNLWLIRPGVGLAWKF